jgi:hypothetical protein
MFYILFPISELSLSPSLEGAASMMTVRVPRSEAGLVGRDVGGGVGRHPAETIRVAVATLDKKIVTKYNIFLRKTHYLVLEGYDPRIHALYFCPQLYKYNSDKQPVALEGE